MFTVYWNMQLKTAILLLFIIFPNMFLFGKENGFSFNENLYLKGKYVYGFIMPHHKSIAYSLEDHIRGIEINLSKPSWGNDFYKDIYRKPRVGVGFYTSNLGNKSVFGNMYALFPYINIPFIIPHHKLRFNYKIAFGFSYLTKTFDLAHNYRNIAISTHNNIYFNLCFNAGWKFAKHAELYNSIGFTHASNGNIQKPNLGLNIVAYSLGLNYNLNPKPLPDGQHEIPTCEKKYEYSLIWSAGARVYEVYDNNLYFASNISFNIGRRTSWKRIFGAGADIFYNNSIRPALKESGQKNISTLDVMRSGVHLYHDFILNKLVINMQLGYYIYSKYHERRIYDRIGLHYKLNNNLLLNLSIKAHYAVADYVEWGIGYYWN
jgi:hypothetical protein